LQWAPVGEFRKKGKRRFDYLRGSGQILQFLPLTGIPISKPKVDLPDNGEKQ
jgi:hypothetical protein